VSDEKKITCECCKKEIPLSVAVSEEGRDYIHHFCSESCYSHYFKDHPKEKPAKK